MSDSPIHLYMVPVCDACVAGEGGECHRPGCVFWLASRNRGPLVGIRVPLEVVNAVYRQGGRS